MSWIVGFFLLTDVGKSTFVKEILSFEWNDKSVWINFVELIGIKTEEADEWRVLSICSSTVDSTTLSSSSVSSSLIVTDEERLFICSSCWSWRKINDTLSVKSASIVSEAILKKNKEILSN